MEPKSTQTFLARGIYKECKWLVENESNEDAKKRKKLNCKALSTAKKQGLRITETQEWSGHRRAAAAMHQCGNRNPVDLELNRPRHKEHDEFEEKAQPSTKMSKRIKKSKLPLYLLNDLSVVGTQELAKSFPVVSQSALQSTPRCLRQGKVAVYCS